MTDAMKPTAYLNARLLDPESGLDAPGALLVQDGLIADLGPRLFNDGLPEGAEAVDCGGHCLAPGLVDMHADLGEPGAEHREGFTSGGQAALAGGVTSVVTLPTTEPVIDKPSMVEFIARRAREKTPVRVHPMAALTKGREGKEMAEIGLLLEAGAVAFGDGDKAIANAGMMRRALAYATTFDALIVAHAMEPSLSGGVMNAGDMATMLGLGGIPTVAETIMVERDLRLVESTAGRWHGAQLTTASAYQAMRAGKKRGLDVTCGTAPHYFMLNDFAVGEYRTFARVSPPLRGEEDRLATIEALKDGTIDVISSQHSPQDAESKRQPFAQAAPGAVGLETMLAVSLSLHHNGEMPLLDLLAKMTINPARRLGLDCGRLAKGAPADLVLFDPEAPWRIEREGLRSKSKNTAFEGLLVQGRVLRTVIGGESVFEYGPQG